MLGKALNLGTTTRTQGLAVTAVTVRDTNGDSRLAEAGSSPSTLGKCVG